MVAINQDCRTIYGGFVLQSYTLIFMNVVIFTIVQTIALNIVLPYLKGIIFTRKNNEKTAAVNEAVGDKNKIELQKNPYFKANKKEPSVELVTTTFDAADDVESIGGAKSQKTELQEHNSRRSVVRQHTSTRLNLQ